MKSLLCILNKFWGCIFHTESNPCLRIQLRQSFSNFQTRGGSLNCPLNSLLPSQSILIISPTKHFCRPNFRVLFDRYRTRYLESIHFVLAGKSKEITKTLLFYFCVLLFPCFFIQRNLILQCHSLDFLFQNSSRKYFIQ